MRYRREYLRGDEKGEAQIFSEALFRAFGHDGLRQAGATLEQRIKKRDAKGTAFADLMWKPRCLIEMKKTGVKRYIALTITAAWERPSVYSFIDSFIRPAASLQVFAFANNYSFGILSSRLRRLWFEARCWRFETRLRYTPTTVFDSFPWPQSPAEKHVRAIEEIVEELLLVRAQNLAAGMSLAEQYNTFRQPGKSRLRTLHADLDAAVHSAYGFSTDEERLTQLLALTSTWRPNLNTEAF